MADLGGRVVACLEARRAEELASLVRRHGGVAYPVPALQELHHMDPADLAEAVDGLCDPRIELVIFATGVGVTDLLAAASALGREAELRANWAAKRVAVRGPKPAAALRRAGLTFSLQATEPHTTPSLLAALADWDLAGARVLMQLAGDPNPVLRDGLLRLGAAEIFEASPYRYGLPSDVAPVQRLMDDLAIGDVVDVVAGTSGPQVANLFTIAEQAGRAATLRQALNRSVVAAQGPVCAAAFERHGVPVAIVPEHGHMGALVLAIAHHFAAPPSFAPPVSAVGAV